MLPCCSKRSNATRVRHKLLTRRFGRAWPYLYSCGWSDRNDDALGLETELSRFAGGLQPSEIRSAVLLGLIGFVIYPVLPNRYVDPWQLFNPSDDWISVIAIAGIVFLNYVLLRIYSTRGLYLGALSGGLVNSSATVA